MRSRDGFTITELLIVLILMGIVGGTAVMSVNRTMAQTRAQRAASVIMTDLKLAPSLAARARRPVRISIDTAGKVFRVRDYQNAATIYSERYFGIDGEYPVQFMEATDTSLMVYPNGLASDSIQVTMRTPGNKRVVKMSRAGQVRLSQ